MRTLLVAVIVAFLKAQLPPLPDTVWKWDGLGTIGNFTEMYVVRSRGNPIVRELYYRTGPSTWQLRAVDSLQLNTQNQIAYWTVKQYSYLQDSSIFRFRLSYPDSRRTEVIIEGQDSASRAWVPYVRIEGVGFGQTAWDLLNSFVFIINEERYLPYPSLYKRSHIGDTLRWYEWDTTSTPPQWSLLFAYARKIGSCDTLVEPISQISWDIVFCFRTPDELVSQRDSAQDSSVTYRYLFYDGGRVVKDSSEYIDYDGQGNITYNRRSIQSYSYDSQGRLSEATELSLFKRGGLILRSSLGPLGRLKKPLHAVPLRQTASVDTSLTRWVLVYSTASSLEGAFRPGCFVYRSQLREGEFSCLAPTDKLTLELYDVLGRPLWQGQVSGSQPLFHLPADLPSGVYILRAGASALRLYLTP